ncbi:MAG: glycoside hydrolase family 3 N-terminal domain-containing protein [Parachlamydiales bacterium]|jgi:beta-N-acetylhexosaminidase
MTFPSGFPAAEAPQIFRRGEGAALANGLSLEEKVGQVFLGCLYTSRSCSGSFLTPSAKAFLHKTKLGNVVYFNWANELSSLEAVRQLSQEIRSEIENITGLQPLIAVDQEGGRVLRLKGRGFSDFPSARALFEAQEGLIGVKKTARKIAEEMHLCGANLNLAPVIDLASETMAGVLQTRTVSAFPEEVCAFGEFFLSGLHEGGVLTTLKHFPGIGGADTDPHLGLPEIKKNLEELEKSDLVPFCRLLGKSDLVMAAHVKLPALDPETMVTFSSRILKGLLREKLGFSGVIVSDALPMRAASGRQGSLNEAIESISEAAQRAFLAGCDLLLLSNLDFADFKATLEMNEEMCFRVMLNFKIAVENGKILPELLDRSVERILALKKTLKD